MTDRKDEQLAAHRGEPDLSSLTTQQGTRVDHTDDSLTSGARGPTLLEDFHAREKITHFDHERIPERVVHARGAGAYGSVFVRFSTVAGSRGSADTVRDVRGFATRFYTGQARRTSSWSDDERRATAVRQRKRHLAGALTHRTSPTIFRGIL